MLSEQEEMLEIEPWLLECTLQDIDSVLEQKNSISLSWADWVQHWQNCSQQTQSNWLIANWGSGRRLCIFFLVCYEYGHPVTCWLCNPISLCKETELASKTPIRPYHDADTWSRSQHKLYAYRLLRTHNEQVCTRSKMNGNASLDDEINRTATATSAFRKLRLWNEKGIKVNIKIRLDKADVLTPQLYGSES